MNRSGQNNSFWGNLIRRTTPATTSRPQPGFRDRPPPKPPRYRYLRSFAPFIISFGLFAFLLSFLALLSHYKSPASKQQLGWQSWDIVRVSDKAKVEGTLGSGNDTTEEWDETDDEWLWGDYGYTLPLDDWDPLAPHTTGLTEIAVAPCYLPPWVTPGYCAPPSTPEEDKTKGKWVIVERDLNIKSGLWYLNVYYRRTRRLDVPLITNLRIAPHPIPDSLQSDLDGWILAEGDLHSGVWPTQSELRLYYKLQEQPKDTSGSRKRQSVLGSKSQYLTEMDVVYGDDEPFYGFERVQGGKVLDALDKKWESVDLAFRRGMYVPEKADELKFHSKGDFKIMQIADLHYSVGKGKCIDTELEPCDGDAETAKWLGEALDAEKPDMVVFSGDQLNGQKTSYDSRSVLAKFARPVIDRKIPWAAVFGNHDSEIGEDRAEQMRTLMNMPYSVAKAGPKTVDGVGNYLIRLHSSDPSHIHLFTLYFLDSGSYQKRTVPWAKWQYDYIKPSQIDWFKNVSSHIDPISRPFVPDGASDLSKIWPLTSRSTPKRLGRDDTRSPVLAKPNAMMFFHIPLPEAYDAPDLDTDGNTLLMGNDIGNDKGSSPINSHFLDEGILPMVAVEGDDGGIPEVKVLAHGHCHVQDRCQRVRGVWMCFDGGSSYSGYGRKEFDRRVRIYQISDFGEKVETYKRTTGGEILDREVLVEPISEA